MTYAERMKGDLLEGIGVTATLEQILISENGRITGFEQVAQNVMMDCVKSIQLAPNGVVTQVYPEEEKKAEEIDLLHDEDRGEISRYARDHDVTVVQGPFEVEQGRYGLAIRNPVYLKKGGESTFWGFVTVIIRVPEIFSDSAKALSEVGYAYRLSKTV